VIGGTRRGVASGASVIKARRSRPVQDPQLHEPTPDTPRGRESENSGKARRLRLKAGRKAGVRDVFRRAGSAAPEKPLGAVGAGLFPQRSLISNVLEAAERTGIEGPH
jgi:hypothetical protein